MIKICLIKNSFGKIGWCYGCRAKADSCLNVISFFSVTSSYFLYKKQQEGKLILFSEVEL